MPGSVGGRPITTLWVSYRVESFTVRIGWTAGHPMGPFREPDEMRIDFDYRWFAENNSHETGTAEANTPAVSGLTTRILRKLPVAHAQALMRDTYESLELEQVKQELSPLPSRVEKDEDYVHIASAYIALAASSVEPIRRLQEWTGESADTWLARLKRARAKGILEGTGQNAHITSGFQAASNQLWIDLRARKGPASGS